MVTTLWHQASALIRKLYSCWFVADLGGKDEKLPRWECKISLFTYINLELLIDNRTMHQAYWRFREIRYRDVNAKVNGFEKMSLISWETIIALCFLCVFHFVFHTSESHVNEHHSSTVYLYSWHEEQCRTAKVNSCSVCCHTYIRILHYLPFTRWWRLLGDSCTVQVHCP